MQIEQKNKLFFIFLSPLPDSQGDIFLQTLTVQPGFAAMDITHIEKASEGRGLWDILVCIFLRTNNQRQCDCK